MSGLRFWFTLRGRVLPSGTILGELEIVEVYETYDVPRLFLAENSIEQRFVVLWASLNAETETWLYLPVSAPRLHAIRSGEVDIHSAFRESEIGYVWEAVFAFSSEEWEVTHCQSARISDRRLPDAGQRIRVTDDAIPELKTPNIAVLATGIKRDAIAISLDYERLFKHEAPIGPLGGFMVAMQGQLDVIGQHKRGKFGPGGSVSPEVLRQTQVLFDSTFRSSFGMNLVASLPPDLSGVSLAAVAVDELMFMMALDNDRLSGFLKQTHNRVAVKYRHFLASLIDNQAGIRMLWQPAGGRNSKQVSMPYQRVVEAYAVVSAVQDEESTTIEVRGTLTAASAVTYYFQIVTLDGKTRYSGKALASAKGALSSARLSSTYDAVLQMVVEVEIATGVENVTYFLVDLKELNDKKPSLQG